MLQALFWSISCLFVYFPCVITCRKVQRSTISVFLACYKLTLFLWLRIWDFLYHDFCYCSFDANICLPVNLSIQIISQNIITRTSHSQWLILRPSPLCQLFLAYTIASFIDIDRDLNNVYSKQLDTATFFTLFTTTGCINSKDDVISLLCNSILLILWNNPVKLINPSSSQLSSHFYNIHLPQI